MGDKVSMGSMLAGLDTLREKLEEADVVPATVGDFVKLVELLMPTVSDDARSYGPSSEERDLEFECEEVLAALDYFEPETPVVA